MRRNTIVTIALLSLAALAPACGDEPAATGDTETLASSVGARRACGQVDEFPITPVSGVTIFPQDIVTGPDGKLWFTTFQTFIGRMSPDDGSTDTVATPSVAGHLAIGPDGNVWYTTGGPGVGRVSRHHGIREIPIPELGFAVDVAADDRFVWVLGFENVARVTADGRIKLFPISDYFASSGDNLVIGADGNVWFSRGPNNALAFYRLTPDGTVTAFPVTGPAGGIFGAALGPDRAIWFTEGGGGPNENAIRRITLDGITSTVVQLPDSTSTDPTAPPTDMPIAITQGPDRKMYFTTYLVNPLNYIGQADRRGRLTKFVVPTPGAASFGITTGSDGNVWFKENFNQSIGRVTITACRRPKDGHGHDDDR